VIQIRESYKSHFKTKRLKLTLIRQTKLLHTCHVHLELALITEEILPVAGSAIALVGATWGRLGSMVLVRCGRPFLACL